MRQPYDLGISQCGRATSDIEDSKKGTLSSSLDYYPMFVVRYGATLRMQRTLLRSVLRFGSEVSTVPQ